MENKVVRILKNQLFDENPDKECTLTVQADLSQVMQRIPDTMGLYTLNMSAPIHLSVQSADCSINYKTVLHQEKTKLEDGAASYSTILSIIALTNLYGTFKLIKDTSDNLIESNKISLITMCFITAWDTFISISHFYLAVKQEAIFHLLYVPTVFYFILFSMFQVKLIANIWRARYCATLSVHKWLEYCILIIDREQSCSRESLLAFISNYVKRILL